MVNLGEVFPNFKAKTTKGDIQFHDWIGDSWAILFSHPADYTPVCTTELASVVQHDKEFEKRGCKIIFLSCNGVEDHKGWAVDVMEYAGCWGKELPFPIIADEDRHLAVKLGMIDPDERTKEGLPLTARCCYIIGPDKRLKLSILYPATTGRNFVEILRCLDSLQLTAAKKVATPVNWQPGEEAMVIPTLSQDEAKALFPNHRHVDVPSGKAYLRFTTEYK